MKKLTLCSFLVVLHLIMTSCASRPEAVTTPPASAAQKRDVTHLVPAELSYAKEFVQMLSDSGWSVEAVYPSKFNGFFRETARAAFIKTDRGVIEAVFFEKDAEVERIQVSEERGGVSGYHKYVVQTPMTKQRLEGAACYFNKYRSVFIITARPELSDALKRLLA